MCWKNNFAYLWGFGDHSLFLAEYRGTLKAKDFSLWIQDVVKPGILDFWTHFPRYVKINKHGALALYLSNLTIIVCIYGYQNKGKKLLSPVSRAANVTTKAI